jgi:2-haloacid dehalogenase
MSNIKYVFLDLDDTIFDFRASEGKALSDMLRSLGVEPTAETLALYNKINRGQWERLERGEATREEILVRRFEILFEALGISRPAREAQKIYEHNLSLEYIYIDGAEELLENLSGKYRLYLASNGTAKVQDSRISRSGIAKYFDGIFISQRVGYDKPSREFFERCFAEIDGFSKDTAIIVGDSLSSDILGGINAGIRTCRYNPKGMPKNPEITPDYEIKSLYELPSLLERI